MPTYHYTCEACKNQETLVQDYGSPKEHPCPKCETGKCTRVLSFKNECTSAAPTPGSCAQRSQETRGADRTMTNIRKKLGKEPNKDPDQIAADIHWGRKNRLIK